MGTIYKSIRNIQDKAVDGSGESNCLRITRKDRSSDRSGLFRRFETRWAGCLQLAAHAYYLVHVAIGHRNALGRVRADY